METMETMIPRRGLHWSSPHSFFGHGSSPESSGGGGGAAGQHVDEWRAQRLPQELFDFYEQQQPPPHPQHSQPGGVTASAAASTDAAREAEPGRPLFLAYGGEGASPAGEGKRPSEEQRDLPWPANWTTSAGDSDCSDDAARARLPGE